VSRALIVFAILVATFTFGPGKIVALQTLTTPEHVSLETQDGWSIAADLYGRGDRGVVLVHGGRFNKESWDKQARELEKLGFRVISIDLRGCGQSKEPPKTKASVEDAYQDVLAATRYLRKTGTKTVSIVGGSMGGDAASEATVHSEVGEIDRVVLLGTQGTDKPELAKGPKLFIVARDDANAEGPRLPGIRNSYKRTPGPKRLVILKGSAHAQFLFATDQGERLMREIVRFLSAQPMS
jgi:pimeloyl-ACP methyl ester carboxylesterase